MLEHTELMRSSTCAQFDSTLVKRRPAGSPAKCAPSRHVLPVPRTPQNLHRRAASVHAEPTAEPPVRTRPAKSPARAPPLQHVQPALLRPGARVLCTQWVRAMSACAFVQRHMHVLVRVHSCFSERACAPPAFVCLRRQRSGADQRRAPNQKSGTLGRAPHARALLVPFV